MRDDDYAGAIRRLVRPQLETPPDLPADERRLVAAVEQALRARARRRVLVRRASALAFTGAAAAAVVLVVGLRGRQDRSERAEAAVAVDGAGLRGDRVLKVLGDATPGAALADARAVSLARGMAVGPGLTLRAPATGEVRVGTADGTSIALEAGGELTVTEAGATQRFTLKSGAVVARVSRLFASERFIVDTRDAEVEVHGTAFRVAVVPGEAGCGGGSTTRVSVLEGVVRVRAGGVETSVPAGGAWPEGCGEPSAHAARATERPHAHVVRHGEPAAAPAPPAEAPPPPPVAAKPAPAPALEPAPATPAPRPASSLAAENDLFAAAVRAKKEGRLAESARLFDELASSHPGSPLVESALVQRMKILATTDPSAAARAAATYLERYPNGFARPEARALVDRAAP